MFSLPARDLLHITANAVIFSGKAFGGLPVLSGARFNVQDDILDVACTDRYTLGHGRSFGINAAGDFTAVLPVEELKPVLHALREDCGSLADIDAQDGTVSFHIGAESFSIPVMDAEFPDPDKLFQARSVRSCVDIGPLGITPWVLAKLAKLKDFHNSSTENTLQTPLAFRTGDQYAAVASFGDNFRVLFTTRQGPCAEDPATPPHWAAGAAPVSG